MHLSHYVRLSLASCGVEHWVMSVWCRVSWCLHCCKATLQQMYVHKEFTRVNRPHTRKCQQNAYLCDMLTAHACTNVHMTTDSIMTLVSLPPDQSFHVPLDIRQRHSFPQQLEKRPVCSCLNLYKECIFTQSLKGKLFLPTL